MGDIIEDPLLRDRYPVFFDRHDAGERLGRFLSALPEIRDPIVVLAIPAGGVPVGRMIAEALGAPLFLAVVRKIRIPGTTESGFGAVAWDGSVLINDRLRMALGLSDREVERAIAETRANVQERIARFLRGERIPPLAGKTVVLTDDGLASGFTMVAAVRSTRNLNPERIVVAVPTASLSAAELVRQEADLVVCLNIRTGRTFAVADAYREWHDLDDAEVIRELSGDLAGGHRA